MVPVCSKDLDPAYYRILELARMIFYRLPDGLTCHDVCQQILEKFYIDHDFMHVIGKFMGCDHSWLASQTRPVILDPYPWACGSGPMLLTLEGYLNPWRKVYDPLPVCLIREDISV